MTQNVAMGLKAERLGRAQYLIISTQGGLRDNDGSPIALGYHTGHWEIGLLVEKAAKTLRAQRRDSLCCLCQRPCDGRSQGTTAMFDSLPYRNDAVSL
ncbi:MAG: hypothetical protein R2880_20865 [Deinococcales bacterium]